MFESLVSQVAGRFGLTDEKTKQLLGMLIGLVFNQNRGGPQGFLNLFREKGLGDVVASWLGNGDNLPINGSQVSNVLGADIINSMGNKLGLPGAAVSDASAALLPTAISTLAHDGNLDVSAWDRAKGWFGGMIDGVDDTFDGTRAATVGAVGAGAAATAAAVNRDRDHTVRTTTTTTTREPVREPVKSSGGMWKWLLPLLALLAAFLIWRSCSTPADTTVDPDPTAPAVEAPATDAAANAANAVGDTAAAGVDAAAAAAKAAEDKARAALGALTDASTTADYKAALDLVPIQFDTAKATIKADSNAILDEAANTIKKMKAGSKIEIQGYTDSDGDDAANMTLSQNRADSVKAALVQRGVSADMLTAKGYGEANPIADNATEAGKAQNRRIAYDIK